MYIWAISWTPGRYAFRKVCPHCVAVQQHLITLCISTRLMQYYLSTHRIPAQSRLSAWECQKLLPDCAATSEWVQGVHITLRMRLHCQIIKAGNEYPNAGDTYEVLNEVVVDRGSNPYLTKIECWESHRLITKVSIITPFCLMATHLYVPSLLPCFITLISMSCSFTL